MTYRLSRFTAAGCLSLAALLGVAPAAILAAPIEAISIGLPSDTPAGSSFDALINSSPIAAEDGRYVAFTSGAPNLLPMPQAVDLQVYFFDAADASTRLVSHAAGDAQTPANGRSQALALSQDGRFLLFASSATNLIAGISDSNGDADLFVFDRDDGSIELVSASAITATATSNHAAASGAISADGRYVVFSSLATDLAAGVVDSNNRHDVFLHDRQSATTTLVSRFHGAALQSADGQSGGATLSANGRYVLFESLASDLVAGVTTNPLIDSLYLYDRVDGSVQLVTRSVVSANSVANGYSRRVALSADGRYAVFASEASDLVAGFTRSHGGSDAFVFDRISGAVQLVSRQAASATAAGNQPSDPISVSADGQQVLFDSKATNLIAGLSDGNDEDDVFLFDLADASTRLVSRSASSPLTTAAGESRAVAISADGGSVLFYTRAADLAAGISDGNGATDAWVYQRSGGSYRLLSRAGSAAATANARSLPTAISASGRRVVFNSLASNVATGVADYNGSTDVYLYDEDLLGATLVSRRTMVAPVAANAGGTPTACSADADVVAYISASTDLVAGVVDTNAERDVYVRDRTTGITELLSRSASDPLHTANEASNAGMISNDGRMVAFESEATDLVAGFSDTNARRDVFLHDRDLGQTVLVSRAATGASAANATSRPIALSGDGRYLVFTSYASNLITGVADANALADVFVHDHVAGTRQLLTTAAGSATSAANGDSQARAASTDGRFVLIDSGASNLVAGVSDSNNTADVFLLDRDTGSTLLVSRSAGNPAISANQESIARALSADGRYALFESSASDLVAGISDANLAPDVFLFDRDSQSILLVSAAAGQATAGNGRSTPVALSADGRFALYYSKSTDLVAGQQDSNGGEDVFLFDRQSGTSTLVSRSLQSPLRTGDRYAIANAISADGSHVLFESGAKDLAAGLNPTDFTSHAYVFQRSSGKVTLISAAASGSGGANDSSTPIAFCGDQRTAIIASRASNLTPGLVDGNQGDDVFVVDIDEIQGSVLFASGFEELVR
jgi:Tol biopolymer transport system component